jgi:PIN domain nuclease of toxin-antitoxin system
VKLLLDTATFLWLTYDASKISPAARAAYADLNNEPHLSVISIWEIIVKNRLGKLPLPLPIDELIAPLRQAGSMAIVPLTETAVVRLSKLPDLHRDPFDRMLICQAIDLGLTLVTPDTLMTSYPVKTLW